MILVPAGRVLLSDRRLQRRWQVDLHAYGMAAVPVTVALYARVALAAGLDAASGAVPDASSSSSIASDGDRSDSVPAPSAPPAGDLADPASPADGGSALPFPPAGPVHPSGPPVVNVSWWDAVRFCNALSESEGMAPPYVLGADGETVTWDRDADGYRLPTEAEWEHACRAGSSGPRYGELDEIAWHRENSGGRLHEVGGKPANAWGLHDMLGNSWDWCWDLYDEEVYGSYRVLRGGGWFDEHWSCRASVRRRSHPTFRVDDVGFRLARSL